MRHVDEGTLHELLDGSLAPAETVRVEMHLANCGACRARLDDARALVRETADLILTLDTPAAPPSASRASVIRRPRWPAAFGWAASITIAVGIGFALHGPTGATGTPAAVTIEAAPPPSVARIAAADAASDRAKGPRQDAVRRTGSIGRAGGNAVSSKTAGPATDPASARAAPAPPEVLRMHPSAAVPLDARAEAGTRHPDSNTITLEEAVQRLGGSIRLIDGLDPVSVARVAGSMVEGADPRRDAILVRYLDPALGVIQLAQQRILTSDSVDALPVPPSVTVAAPRAAATTVQAQEARSSVSWRDGHGFQMTLTASAPAGSLAALRARVH